MAKYTFKIIIVGDAAVGKTSLVLNYVKKIFKTNYLPTIGVDIYNKDITIDGDLIKIMVWDIAGQIGWEIMHKSYYRGAEGVFAVFDLTRKDTLKKLDYWLDNVKKYTKPGIPIIILGNKSDLTISKEINKEEINFFLKKKNFIYIDTSAKTGQNVYMAFNLLLERILKK